MALDLAHGHAAGVERQDLFSETGPAGLVLGNQLRLEGAMPVTGNCDRQLAELAFECLSTLAVVGVAGGISHQFVLAVT